MGKTVKNSTPKTIEVKINTLEVLSQAIRNGLTNGELIVNTKQLTTPFKTFLGNLSVMGIYSIDDIVPAGVFIFGEDNFISSPDAIFTDYKEGFKIGFYTL